MKAVFLTLAFLFSTSVFAGTDYSCWVTNSLGYKEYSAKMSIDETTIDFSSVSVSGEMVIDSAQFQKSQDFEPIWSYKETTGLISSSPTYIFFHSNDAYHETFTIDIYPDGSKGNVSIRFGQYQCRKK